MRFPVDRQKYPILELLFLGGIFMGLGGKRALMGLVGGLWGLLRCTPVGDAVGIEEGQ